MSRTYRRRGQRHDYDWVLHDSRWVNGILVPFFIDPRSKEGRRAITRFNSDTHAERDTATPLARRSRLRPNVGAHRGILTARNGCPVVPHRAG